MKRTRKLKEFNEQFEKLLKDGMFDDRESRSLVDLFLELSNRSQDEALYRIMDRAEEASRFLDLLFERRNEVKGQAKLRLLCMLSKLNSEKSAYFISELMHGWNKSKNKEKLLDFLAKLTGLATLDVISEYLKSRPKLRVSDVNSLSQIVNELLGKVVGERKKEKDDFLLQFLNFVKENWSSIDRKTAREIIIRAARFYNLPSPELRGIFNDILEMMKSQKGSEWEVARNMIARLAETSERRVIADAESDEKEIAKLARENEKLRRDLDKAKHQLTEKERSIREIEAKLSEQIESDERLKSENNRLKEKIIKLDIEISRLKKEIAEKEKHIRLVIEREERTKESAVMVFAGKVASSLRPYFENLKAIEESSRKISQTESMLIHYFQRIRENLRRLNIPL